MGPYFAQDFVMAGRILLFFGSPSKKLEQKKQRELRRQYSIKDSFGKLLHQRILVER